MSYRKITKYFQNIKLYGIIGAAVIMAMSVTACSTVKNSGTEITADQTSAGLADGTTVNGIYSYDDMFTERDLDVGYDESSAVKINLADDSTTVTVGDDTEADASEADETKADDSETDGTKDGGAETDETKADESETDGTKADESVTNETETASSGVSISGNIITITKEGTYVFSGALSEGQIVVDADSAKVQLVLDNADITCASSAAIYVKNADKTFITLAEGSENILMNTAEYEAIDDNNIDAVIFSKDDLTLNGKGTLTINSEYGHGIVSKDDLKLVGGICNITAKAHALSGKDSVRIAAGTYNLTSGKDGIHSENADDDEKGFVYIASGDFTIESTGDGIDASYVVQIDDGDFDITAGDGAENATKTHKDIPGGGAGDNMGGGAPGGAAQDGEAPSGDKPSGGKPSGDKPSGDATSGDATGGDTSGGNLKGGDGSDESVSGSASGKQTGQTPPDRPDGDSFDGSRPDEKASDNAGSQTSQTPPDKSGKDTSDGQQSDKNSQSKDAADSTTASGASSDTDSEAASSTSSDTDSTSTKGIKSDGALYVNGGTFTINSADDAFHSNSDVTINDGTYTISSGDDGMHADSALLVNGGTITVTESYEGLEGLNITINDGKIEITASDDGMNAAGGNDASGFGGRGGDGFKGMQAPDAAQKPDDTSDNTSDNTQKPNDTSDTAQTTGNITVAAQKSDSASDTAQTTGNITVAAQKSDNTSVASQDTDTASEDEMWMVINGGYVHVLAGGDGLDSNGDLTINGGEVYVDGPSDNGNSAIDYGEKSSFYINGGTVVAVGSSGMAEDVSSDSKQQVAFVKLDSQADAGDVTLKDADGNEIISYTAKKKYDCVIISTADMKEGQTYTLSASGNESEVSL